MFHWPPLGCARFESYNIGFRHLPVTRQPKEQRDVDVGSFADELFDGGQSFGLTGRAFPLFSKDYLS